MRFETAILRSKQPCCVEVNPLGPGFGHSSCFLLQIQKKVLWSRSAICAVSNNKTE